MGILFAPGVAQKIRDQIAVWKVVSKELAREIFEALEGIDDDPGVGTRDTKGIFHGALFFQFRIDRPPLVLNVSVAYKVEQTPDGHDVRILDFEPRRVSG